MSSIGSRLTALVAHAPGLSLRILDRLAGYPKSGLAQKLATDPERRIDAKILAGYAAALGSSLDYLVTGEGDPPGPIVVRRSVAAARERLGAGGRHASTVTTSSGARKTARPSSKAAPRRSSARA